MKYAPVLIPTLNRYEHFRKCIESLSRCTWADQTEVFVALDYPPSEKYVEGWKKNKQYLENCGDLGFKKLHVIYRDHNYGTWQPGDEGNHRSLIREIEKQFDRYITSEDDNVFSPNFLEFMNKGLERFEDDEKVLCLCAFRWFFPIKSDGNTYFRSGVSNTPWGLGRWTKKQKAIPNLDYKWFRSQLSIPNLIKVYKNSGPGFMNTFIEFSNADPRHARPVDAHVGIYMTLAGMHQIVPMESLVKNIGLDGSGVTMPENNVEMQRSYDSIPTSHDEHFEFVGSGYEFYDENMNIYRKERNYQSKKYYFIHFFRKLARLLKYW